ncbi:MAG: extracellular solute-binding protein [Chloroflexi bacterium]|nr:extracellular solute-binding protein [Chloroflexota bacterium]
MRKILLWGLVAAIAVTAIFALFNSDVVKGRVPKLILGGQKKAATAPPPSSAQLEQGKWDRVVSLARKEGRVTIYSWSWTPTTAGPVIRAFTQKYGIEVEVVAGRGPAFIEMLRQEAVTGARIGDIMEGAQTHARNARLAGLTVSALDLPVLRDGNAWAFSPLHMDGQGHVISYAPYILSPYVNTTLVAPSEEPRSWLDLLQPRWKGKMVMPNPKNSTVPYYLDVLLRHNALPGDFPARLARQDVLLSEQTPDSGELLGWGRAALSVLNAMPDMVPPLRDGGPIRAIDMKEGVLVSLLTMALVKDGPHPNAARVFLNWLLTDEGQVEHGRAKMVESVRKGVSDYTPSVFKLDPRRTIVINDEEGERIARAFREKTYVPVFFGGTQ